MQRGEEEGELGEAGGAKEPLGGAFWAGDERSAGLAGLDFVCGGGCGFQTETMGEGRKVDMAPPSQSLYDINEISSRIEQTDERDTPVALLVGSVNRGE